MAFSQWTGLNLHVLASWLALVLRKGTSGHPAELQTDTVRGQGTLPGLSYLYLQGRAIRANSLSSALFGLSVPTACLQILQVLFDVVLHLLQ